MGLNVSMGNDTHGREQCPSPGINTLVQSRGGFGVPAHQLWQGWFDVRQLDGLG